MSLQCVVLAGGLGTRMRPLTASVPKALIPVAGRPFVDWQLELLADRGVEEVLFSVGYRGEMLRGHVGDGRRWGLSVDWISEGHDLRGTAGALRLAYDLGALRSSFFVLYGDSYLPIDMAAVEQAWRLSRMPSLMTVLRNDGQWDASNAIYDGGRVVLYDKSRPARVRDSLRWIDYGLSVMTHGVVADLIPSGERTDLADILHKLSVTGQLAGYEVFDRFYEAGSPAGLLDLEAYLGTVTSDR